MASASENERVAAIGTGDPAWIAARMQRLPTTRFSWMIVLLAAGALVVEALDIGTLGTILPVLKRRWR